MEILREIRTNPNGNIIYSCQCRCGRKFNLSHKGIGRRAWQEITCKKCHLIEMEKKYPGYAEHLKQIKEDEKLEPHEFLKKRVFQIIEDARHLNYETGCFANSSLEKDSI
jgi:hypothetical protein